MSGDVLIVTTRYPLVASSGARRRLESIVRAARDLGEVDLLCFAPPSNALRDRAAEATMFRAVHLVPWGRVSSVASAVRSLARGEAIQLGLFASSAMRTWLNVNSGRYAVAVFHLIRAGQFMTECRASRRVLEMTDALSLAYLRRARSAGMLSQLFWARESAGCLRAEEAQIAEADAIILISDVDRAYLRSMLAFGVGHVASIPIAVPDSLFEIPYAPARPGLCFIGAMWFGPNIEACRWFVREVMPRLRVRLPEAHLDVVGSGPRKLLRELAQGPGVVTHGFVSDLRTVVGGTLASVAPMQSGSGLQTKLLESVAMGLPTLCSPLAAEPLGNAFGDELMVCATPDDYVDRIVQLWNDPALRVQRSARGRDAVRRSFGEKAFRRLYQTALRPLAVP